jgi:hypothetical protein
MSMSNEKPKNMVREFAKGAAKAAIKVYDAIPAQPVTGSKPAPVEAQHETNDNSPRICPIKLHINWVYVFPDETGGPDTDCMKSKCAVWSSRRRCCGLIR